MDIKLQHAIWNNLIFPTYESYNKKTGNLVCAPNSSDEIAEYYEELLAHAKTHYMENRENLLNRHKVAAALMIAILKVKPIKKAHPMYFLPDENGEITIWPYNEALAVTVALSILRAFILKRAEYAFSGKCVPKNLFEKVCKQDNIIFANEFPLERRERDEWEYELYQVRQEGAYNLLSMAHILAQMEEIARLRYFQRTKSDPTYPDSKFLVEDLEADVEWINKIDEIVENATLIGNTTSSSPKTNEKKRKIGSIFFQNNKNA